MELDTLVNNVTIITKKASTLVRYQPIVIP